MESMELLSVVSKDIIDLDFNFDKHTLKDCYEMFLDVMRKYDIKQGTASYNEAGKRVGYCGDNYEWTICFKLFMSQLNDKFNWSVIMLDVPYEFIAE